MKIGVFDSGIGGLTVLKAIWQRWPEHSTVYLGDTARVPYGSKSAETVARYARQNGHYLLEHGIDLLVVACNTASAYGLEALQDLTLPVVGMIEPGAEIACASHAAGDAPHLAVIGTRSTVASEAYSRALHRRLPQARVSAIACPMFVPLVEEGWEATAIARQCVERYLAPWLPGCPERPEALVLGCTHYPILAPTLAEVLGPEVRLIDSAHAAAQALTPYLDQASAETAPEHTLFVTDGAPGFTTIAERILGTLPTPLETTDL